MNQPLITMLGAAMVLAACGSAPEDESPTAGMTAEEHAKMLGGGTQGAMDSTGAAVRQVVHLTEAQERSLGVVYTTVERQTLTRSIRTVGRVEAAEPRVADVTPKIDGFVERLFVDQTGETVRRGQRLLSIYSPMLVAAQEELLTARRLVAQLDPGSGEAWRSAQAMLDAARRRLLYWDITEKQIEQLEQSGEVTKTLTLVSPVTGIVLDKMVVEGQQVMPGMRLYRVADLSVVWIEGDVFEQDLRFIEVGSQAHIEVSAYPGEHLMGLVSFVHPTVDPASRTNRVRVTAPNRDGRLKPGMYATTFFDVTLPGVLAVPVAAVVVTGERNLVFVRDTAGMLAPRDVVLGVRAGERVQILEGLTQGETIVASANFLVDAESRLASSGGAMPGMQHGTPATADTQPSEHRHD